MKAWARCARLVTEGDTREVCSPTGVLVSATDLSALAAALDRAGLAHTRALRTDCWSRPPPRGYRSVADVGGSMARMDSTHPIRLAGGYVLGWVVSGLVFLGGMALVGVVYRMGGPARGSLDVWLVVAAASVCMVTACAAGARVLPRAQIDSGPLTWSMATVPGPLLIVVVTVATAQAALGDLYDDQPFSASPPAAVLIAAVAAVIGALGATLVARARRS